MSDASLGVTNPGYRPGDTATALPAGIALGASFNPALARASGAMVGREARSRGLNVMLAGGVNLARDPRNGRNFEYLSEDPLLSGVLAGEAIAGIQGEGVISTDQALLAELQRDQPPLARRDHRPGRAPRVGPARVRDRHRARAARLGHDRLQQGQRRLRGRQPGPHRGDPQGGVGLPGLGHVRLGRDAHLGLRAGGPRPGVGRADRRGHVGRRVLHRAAARGVRGGASCRGSACRTWCGASCARCTRSASMGGRPGGPGRRTTRRRTTRSRWRARARASCCSTTTASCRWPPAEHADRGHRRLRRPGRARRHRLERGPAGRRLRGRGPHRRPGDHGQHAQPVPAAVVAGAGARARSCPRPRSSSTPG